MDGRGSPYIIFKLKIEKPIKQKNVLLKLNINWKKNNYKLRSEKKLLAKHNFILWEKYLHKIEKQLWPRRIKIKFHIKEIQRKCMKWDEEGGQTLFINFLN